MKVLIASMRAPKVNGVQRAFQKLSHISPFNSILFEPMHIESGVQATPLSIDELMTGARQRAETAFASASPKSSGIIFSVGVEGGLYVFQKHAFLQSWACVYDGERISF